MDKQHREVRAKLQRMAPARATEYVAAVYDYLHEKQIEKAQEVKNLLAMYREM